MRTVRGSQLGHNALFYHSLTGQPDHEGVPGSEPVIRSGYRGRYRDHSRQPWVHLSPEGSLAGLRWRLSARLAFSSPLTGSAAAQGVVRSVHADWQIRCDTPPGAQGEQCALIQSVTAEDRANVGLTVIVLKTSDNKSRLMRIVAPMGVLLPSGPRPQDRQ